MRAAVVTLIAALAPTAGAATSAAPVPIEALARHVETDGRVLLAPEGLVLDVIRRQTLALPVRDAARLELDLRSEGYFALTWTHEGPPLETPAFWPPPLLDVAPGKATVALDLLVGGAPRPGARPLLTVVGSGRLVIAAVRAAPGGHDLSDVERRAAWSTLVSPQPHWPAAINFVNAPALSLRPVVWFADAVAVLAAVVAVAAGAIAWRRLGRVRALAVALLTACVSATLASDALLLARYLPGFRLAPTPDPEDRIRAHYDFDPDVGVLAALARATLPLSDRVGVVAPADEWFPAQTLCFDLAPRPCVKIAGDGPRYSGISGVGTLALDELDAVVVATDRAPPPGFVPVAVASPGNYVARRP